MPDSDASAGEADLVVTVDDLTLSAIWTDTDSPTRDAIAGALPVEGDAARWGDELYVRTGIDVPAADARREVPVGALAYWPQGNAICLFWGPTPASDGDAPVAASPVNVFATVHDVAPLADVDGDAHLHLATPD